MSLGPPVGEGACAISQLLPCALVQRRRRRWLTLVKYGVGLALIYFLSRLKAFKIQESTHIRSMSKPDIVWDFLADFNNMKQLNPTIIDFEIISDKGLYNDWKYTVKYSEFLHNAPSIKNTITADFHVKKTNDGNHSIDSVHTTCFFFSLYCVRAWGRFEIRRHDKIVPGVDILESVTFECPLMFYWFCYKEASYQRKQIKENLVNFFDGLKTQRHVQ